MSGMRKEKEHHFQNLQCVISQASQNQYPLGEHSRKKSRKCALRPHHLEFHQALRDCSCRAHCCAFLKHPHLLTEPHYFNMFQALAQNTDLKERLRRIHAESLLLDSPAVAKSGDNLAEVGRFLVW